MWIWHLWRTGHIILALSLRQERGEGNRHSQGSKTGWWAQ
jgi:hypothetical protein